MIAFISLFVQDSLTDIVWGGRAVCAASDLHDVDQVLGMWDPGGSWGSAGCVVLVGRIRGVVKP